MKIFGRRNQQLPQELQRKNLMLKLILDKSRVNFLKLNISKPRMHKLVALNKNLEKTSLIVTLKETLKIIFNHEFANLEKLQSCDNRDRKGMSLFIEVNLSFCEKPDLKTSEVDAVWSTVHIE